MVKNVGTLTITNEERVQPDSTHGTKEAMHRLWADAAQKRTLDTIVMDMMQRH